MDPLTQIVGHLAPEGLSWKRIIGRPDWAFAMPAVQGIVFGMVLEGDAWAGCGDRLALRTGDYLLLINPSPWTLGTGDDGAVEPFPDVRSGTVEARGYPSGTRLATRIMAGHFHAGLEVADLLGSLLPEIVHVSSDNAHGERLKLLLTFLDEETGTDQPGQEAVTRRLLEMMLIEGLRATARTPDSAEVSLLRGLAEPRLAKALQAIHENFSGHWSVRGLADIAGMSRSSFSEYFLRLIGMPPMAYVNAWRLTTARQALRQSDIPISVIARQSGYGSTSAFSNAFRSVVGVGPAGYRAG